MVGWQKSKCSSSWPPITTFTCIVNIQTFKRSRRADVCCDWSIQSVTIETCCLRCAHTVSGVASMEQMEQLLPPDRPGPLT